MKIGILFIIFALSTVSAKAGASEFDDFILTPVKGDTAQSHVDQGNDDQPRETGTENKRGQTADCVKTVSQVDLLKVKFMNLDYEKEYRRGIELA